MRVVADGPDGAFVAVTGPEGEALPVVVTVRPEEREQEVRDALAAPVEVWAPVHVDDSTKGEGVETLNPGDPGHAAAAVDALPWIVNVADFEAGTLPEEG